MNLRKRIEALESVEGAQIDVDGMHLAFRVWSEALEEWTRERSDVALFETVLFGTAIERKMNAGDVLPEADRFNAWRKSLGEPLEEIRSAFEAAGWVRDYLNRIQEMRRRHDH